MRSGNRVTSLLTAAAVSVSVLAFGTCSEDDAAMTAQAADTLYPAQEFRLGISNTDRNAAANGTAVTSATLAGKDSEKWTLNYISDNLYEIVSAANGYILTGSGSSVSLAADTDDAAQRWRIEGVQKDYDGYYLYYKITNDSTGQALTFQPSGNTFTLSGYSGDPYQKYKLNLDGLEGFAANCKTDQGEKAGTIGGLLGKTVYAATADELEKALDSTEPMTVVLTADVDMRNAGFTRIRDNKTLVGSYGKRKIQDCQLRTNNEYGTAGDDPSDNIVIRNIHFVAQNVEDKILLQIWSSRQIWIDHNTFTSNLTRAVDEVGKFIWLNTPYDNYMDAKDRLRSPDYITISYCKFTNRFWTVAYGTQNTETTRCRTTLNYNWWDNCARRCPQIGNGIGHVYNNYYAFSGSDASEQIIVGDGCNMLSENCMFEGLKGHEMIGGGGSSSPFTDSGSYTAPTIGGSASPINYVTKYKTSLTPKDHYGYSLLSAYGGNDTKTFCKAYAGCFGSDQNIKYITDSDLAHFVKTKHDCPFQEHADVTDAKQGAAMDTSHKYRFVNVGSGLSLEVANAEAASGANVQQGSTGADGWTLADAGEGYYYIYSELGDGRTFVLDLPYGSTDNGTSIGIWTNDESDARKFKFVDNGDGSYTITTKATKDAGCIGIYAGSKDAGADAIQWTSDGADNQKWKAVIKIDPISGTLIRDLAVKDTATYQNWSIGDSAAVGDLVYGDRDVTYTAIPEALLGAEYVRTACDAKNLSADLAEFKAGADCTVYVALDSRVTSAPAWLTGWTKTAETIVNSKNVTFILYAKEVKQDDPVTLGTNGQSSGCVGYTVFAVQNVTVKGDANGDGAFSVADVTMLQKWLLNTGTLTDSNAADVCPDGRIDAFDLCVMKRMLLKK